MDTCTAFRLKAKTIYLQPILFIASIGIVNAMDPGYSLSPAVINNGGGVSSSSNYTTYSSLGQLTGGSFSSINYQIQSDSLSILDTDNDGILDNTDNCLTVSNNNQINTDLDSQGDACDADDDNDGLSDVIEISQGTNPLLTDTDGDGLDDGVDPNPLIPNADGDLAPYGAPDGVVTIADLLIAQKIVSGIITPTTQDIIHADVYPVGAPDGAIDMSDLLQLIKMISLAGP